VITSPIWFVMTHASNAGDTDRSGVLWTIHKSRVKLLQATLKRMSFWAFWISSSTATSYINIIEPTTYLWIQVKLQFTVVKTGRV
jgi:hypothetical protein